MTIVPLPNSSFLIKSNSSFFILHSLFLKLSAYNKYYAVAFIFSITKRSTFEKGQNIYTIAAAIDGPAHGGEGAD
jgi:hypothetical protein